MPILLSRPLALVAVALAFYPLALWWFPALPSTDDVQARVIAGGLALAILGGFAARFVSLARIVAVLVAGWLLACVHVGGATAALAFMLTGAAATATGLRIVGGSSSLQPLERALAAYLVGIALMTAVLSPLLALRLHYQAAYAVACLAVIAWQWRALAQLAGELRARWTEATAARPSWLVGTLAILAALLWGYGGLAALMPVAAFDDVAAHLRLPHELLNAHQYSFDVAHHIWAASPWAADLAFAIPFVVSGGNEGVKAWVAGSYHLASAAFLFGLLRRRISAAPALLLVAGYLSTPLMIAVTHTLHTEGASAAIVLAIFVLWIADRESPGDARPAIAASLLLGLLGATKSSNLVACAFLGLVWLPSLWRQARIRPRVALAIVAGLATAATPYITAWIRTGNPVFPLMNAIFKSPYYEPVNFANSLYAGHFGPGLYAGLFLDGPRYLETGTPIAAGLALFFLLPAAALVVALRGDRERRIALAVVLAYSLVLLMSQQYIRYLFPVMGLAFFGVSVLWQAAPDAGPRASQAWLAWWSALVALALLFNAHAMSRTFWQTDYEAMIAAIVQPDGRARYLDRFAPERVLTAAANADWGRHATVAYPMAALGADLQGTPIYPSWYNPRAWKALEAVTDEAGAAKFVRDMHLTHIVVKGLPERSKSLDAVVQYAFKHGSIRASAGNEVLVAFEDDIAWPRELWRLEPEKVGSEVDPKRLITGQALVTGGKPVLVELRGTCDSLLAHPGVDLIWRYRGFGIGAHSRLALCVPRTDGAAGGTFALRLVVEAPRRVDDVWIRIATYGDLPARITSARVRALAE